MNERNEFKIRAINRQLVGFTKGLFDFNLFFSIESSIDDNQWTEPFFFICGADTQFGLIDEQLKNPTFKSGFYIKDPDWSEEIRLTGEAIKSANKMKPKPKFFVVCGDLVNGKPGHRDKRAQTIDFKKCFQELDNSIPLVCVCGNHDIGDTPTPLAIKEYRKDFGDDYFSFSCGGVLFVVLNSQYFADQSLCGQLAEEHDQWLDAVLKEFKTNKLYKHLIVFQHIPWFVKDYNEDRVYFKAADSDHQINIDKPLRLEILDKLYESGVRYIFCGHYHRNGGGMYKDMELVVTSAIGAQLYRDCCDDKSGIRIVKVFDNYVKHQYYNIEDIPEEIEF